MRSCVASLRGAAAVFLISLLFALPASAQGGSGSTLSGVVVDTAGGVIPGADVVVKHNATGVKNNSVTNAEGVFSFPGLNIGTYTVTVTLAGFKTFIATDVVLTSTAPASVRAALEVGGITETVSVSSTAEIVQTQSTTISSTITTNQIVKLPLTTRSAMDFVTFLPGVNTPGGNRSSTVNGLPQGLINITLDGVNIQDNTLRSSDGFFSIVSPRLDAIEEVSVTTASQGAESAQGAIQIKFVTRSGTNRFTGSGYEYYRRDRLNANTWFNIRDNVAKAKLKQDQYGFRVGGPIVIPGLFDGRNRAFFFVNYEEQRQPSDTTRNRTVLNTTAQSGIYSYTTAGGAVQQVNVLALAAANNQVSTLDPITSKILADIRTAVNGGSLTDLDPNLQRFTYNLPVQSLRRYPTGRLDYNITQNHRFSTAFNYQLYTDYPDTLNNRDAMFPGFPIQAGQSSERLSFSNTLRSTLRSNLVNEARVGLSSSPVKFFSELTASMWGGTKVADQGGFQISLGTVGSGLTNASASPSPQARNAYALAIEDTLSWLKGSHSITLGSSWTQYTYWGWDSSLVPSVSFGIVTGDPAQAMISFANFPGAAQTNLNAAQALYVLLTGRVSSISGNARIDEASNKYSYMGVGMQRTRMRETGFYFQDSWRWKPNLTVNMGLRYDIQFPFFPLNNYYSTTSMADLCGISGVNSQGACNLFMPGTVGGKLQPQFYQYTKGTPGYKVDHNNVAPNLGIAWTTGGKSGLLRTLFGEDGGSVIRASLSRAYNRNGMNDFSSRYANNPGGSISVSRNANLGNLGALPLLFRDTARLAAPAFPDTPVYPMTNDPTQSINMFDPNIQVPYADTWTVGIQRSIGRSTAVEVRYIGTRSRQNWANVNYNEANIYENGFITEFRAAQANLQANLAAGRGATFKYAGPGTGTVPLPIMMAYFSAMSGTAVNDTANYTSSNFTNSTMLGRLATYNPSPFGLAGDLYGNATLRGNALTAGLPINFFLMNPNEQGGAVLTRNVNSTNYNAIQVELRRSFSKGLQFQTSYSFGRAETSSLRTLRKPVVMVRPTGSSGDLTHALKANVVYDLPFGRGRAIGGNAGSVLDRIIAGWTLGLTSRIQSGQLVDLGNVRLVGMTAKDVHNMYQLRIDPTSRKVYMLPQAVIDATIQAFSVSASSTTGYGTLGAPTGQYFAPANGPDCIEINSGANYGSCGTRSLVVTGPTFQQHDISLAKRVQVVGRTNLEFRIEILNAFNKANFVPQGGLGNQLTSYEVTSLTGTNTARTTQIVFRFNW